jgi:hypothetical protein
MVRDPELTEGRFRRTWASTGGLRDTRRWKAMLLWKQSFGSRRIPKAIR